MKDGYYEVNDLSIETDEITYNIGKNFVKNNDKSPDAFFYALRSLNNNLTNNVFSDVLINSTLRYNDIILNEVINTINLTPSAIQLNTSTTANYNYTIAVKSPVALLKVYTIDGINSLNYIQFVVGTARACIQSADLIDTGKTETDYNYNINLSIRIEQGYKYSSRNKLYVKFMFITQFGAMGKYLNVTLIEE